MNTKHMILALILLILVIVGCAPVLRAVPDSPFEANYEVRVYGVERDLVMFTNSKPLVKGDFVQVFNYWWREFDEEGNVEWLRRDEDYYYVIIPVDEPVTVRELKGGTAEIVRMYEE